MCAKRDGKTGFSKEIVSLLNKNHVIETDSLREYFSGRSRRSVFRDLSSIEHLSSMTHAGRSITLPHIPQFDANGLWFFREIGFSVDGAIKGTIQRIVSESDAGKTPKELKKIFRVRIHNVLIGLIRKKKLTRVPIGDAERNLYLSADTLSARKQLEKRQTFLQNMTIEQTLSPLVVIQVLAEIIRSGEIHVGAPGILERLHQAGVEITIEQVNYVFSRYGIGVKKTPRSR